MAANINQYLTSQTISYIEQSDEEKQRLREDASFFLHLLHMSGEDLSQCCTCFRYISEQWKLDNGVGQFISRMLIECFGCRQRWCWGCVKTKRVCVYK